MPSREYSERLRAAREARGLERRELAARAGIHPSAWVDLELDDGELMTGISFAEVRAVLQALELNPLQFFSPPGAGRSVESFPSLVDAVKDHLRQTSLGLSTFEERVGWELTPLLENPGKFSEMPLQAVIDVAAPLHLDWRPLLLSAEG